MKTGYVILISTVTSVAVVLLLFFCFNRFANWGIIGSRIAEQRHQQGDAYKMLGRMGEAMKDYAGIAIGASDMSDEEAALKMAGASFDFAGDCLEAVSGDDPLIDAAASFYGAAGDALSEPSKTKERLKNLEESVSNFIDRLF